MEFFEIYDQYYQRVRNFILSSVRDEWAADDLTQETFIRVQKNLNTLKDSSKLTSWIFRIAHNLCRDHFRNLKRTSSHECELDEARDVFKEAMVQKRARTARDEFVRSGRSEASARIIPKCYHTIRHGGTQPPRDRRHTGHDRRECKGETAPCPEGIAGVARKKMYVRSG